MINKSLKKLIKESVGYVYYNTYKKYCNNTGNKTLIYHAFGSKLKHDTYGISISINKFKDQMKYLKDNYELQSLDKPFLDYKNTISITIDDGYKDTLDAVNILNQFQIPFMLFITTDSINHSQYLNSDDIYDISLLDICKIGTHGKSHRKLSNLSYDEQFEELNISKKVLEDISGNNISYVSFPHGSFNDDTLKVLHFIGYEKAFTSVKGFNLSTTPNYCISRSEVVKSDTLSTLNKKIIGFYDFY